MDLTGLRLSCYWSFLPPGSCTEYFSFPSLETIHLMWLRASSSAVSLSDFYFVPDKGSGFVEMSVVGQPDLGNKVSGLSSVSWREE